jgi:D-glycero-D-manno-heptose 1,7-bisphosphate phosphatase
VTAGRRPAVFVDRDGTLIVERDYLADPAGVELVDGAAGALRALRGAGYALVVVTNQSGIARGLYTEDDYRRVAARLDHVLEERGVPVDGTYYCPHHPDFTGPCTCRKPGTGMYEQAARDLDLDLAASWYVGDKVADVLPALALGGRGILVRSGYGTEQEGDAPDAVTVVEDLGGAARLVLAADRSGADGPSRR